MRFQKASAHDIYLFFNMDDPRYPNLPPPPNPARLQSFYLACIAKTVEQVNFENDPEAQKRAEQEQHMLEDLRRRNMTP